MFRDKKVLVIGLGRSGLGAVKLLKALEARVMVSEKAPLSEQTLKKLQNGVFLQMGSHKVELADEAELIVVSPGVPPDNPIVQRAEALGRRIISEVELAWIVGSATVPNWIAITGTNGKSTTTTLVDLMLRVSGIRVLTGGNIGTAISELVADRIVPSSEEQPVQWINIEVSSFQLERIETFRPKISVMLNITEDHMDRYPDLASYVRAKTRVWENQSEGDIVVVNNDDPLVMSLKPPEGVRVYKFSRTREVEGAFLRQGKIFLSKDNQEIEVIEVDEMLLKGVHNQENAMAAALVSWLAGASIEAIREVLKDFPGLAHRLQFVAEVDGIKFYDDSKGTNVASVVKSVESFSCPVVLILGGQDKGLDFRALRSLKHIKAIVALGEAIPKILGHLDGYFQVHPVPDMDSAVKVAYCLAAEGEVVLLSPGCASFDMFRDYSHRGKVFQEVVKSLKDTNKEGKVLC